MRYEEYVNIQLGKLRGGGLIDPDILPDIDLYIDQLVSFFEKQTDKVDSETAKRFLTKPMINSYAKNDIIPRPDGKKYSRDHMLMIIMAAYLKGIFKVDDIKYLMHPLVENYNSEFDESIDPELVYRTACETNADYAEQLAGDVDQSMDIIKKIYEENAMDDDEQMEVFTLVLSLAMKADMAKYMADRLIEKYFLEQAGKEDRPKKQKK